MFYDLNKINVLPTYTGKFEFEAGAVSRLRPECRQRQADNPRGAASQLRQASCGPKTSSGKPTTRERETVEETVGREPLRERTLRLNLFGATLFEFELGAWRPAWPKPPSGSHHHPGSVASCVAEATIKTPLSPLERGSRVAEATIVSHSLQFNFKLNESVSQ